MIRIEDTIAGEPIQFYCVEERRDLYAVRDFVNAFDRLALDTEASGVNCYRRGWRMRTFQVGNENESYVVPAKYKDFIWWVMQSDTKWIGHNGPHDIRSIDRHLGRATRVVCAETHIPAHHRDARPPRDGGTGHGLKELAVALVDPQADKWEKRLKEAFKEIYIPIEGEVYKSGPRKGTQKMRKAKMSEGWDLIDLFHPAYVAYAAADPLLTFRVRNKLRPVVMSNVELYKFDLAVALGCDVLQRRAIRLDVPYTKRLSRAYLRKAQRLQRRIDAFRPGGVNINSTAHIAEVLESLEVNLTEKTDSGKWKVDGDVLRGLLDDPYVNQKVKEFIHLVLVAKQILKRRESYTEGMLRERDENDRVHPSINSLAARTARWSVSNPALQQLPTKDREDEELWESEEEL